LVERIPFAKVFAKVQSLTADSESQKRIANWLIGYSPNNNDQEDDLNTELPELNPESLIKLSDLVSSGKLSSTAAKEVLEQLIQKDEDPEEIANRLNLIQMSNDSELEDVVQKVMDDNPKAVEDLRSGEQKAIGALIGQIMKQTGGKANPAKAQEIIKSKL
jgi:aspartyl-tRNA(Asn)/glutamyl-tRNA(Gln) amidotransferase subunit B